ncbi:hypothetical protein M3P05_07585 [Sansalvadorimonas sp. 2012CJ34-2]|uniref:Uncharacterized protein n=1 Tax=Parendozoicomonas callyspongiae TaxID=2942213 RepID=A0ABT0PER5_9GAMM|nr:DUF6586 family protein [Sansalvadorimonas sp. 2012CJ34-2]MCL6269800.1 hypothetical protein [Sansalvadorimonas sp. 2012CJ34-2]
MSRQFVEYTNKKLMMARVSWLAAVDTEGITRQGFREGFLFHCACAVSGLLAEILEGCLMRPQQPVTFEEAERLLAHEKVLSGSFQQVKNLKEHGWLGVLLNDYEQTLHIEEQDSDNAFHNLIASSRTGQSCVGSEGDYLQSLQKLVQDIRGQLQEW